MSEEKVAIVKVYGKVLGFIVLGVWAVLSTVISNRAVNALEARETRIRNLEVKVENLAKEGLTKEDIRVELKNFKLELIEDGLIIVQPGNRRK